MTQQPDTSQADTQTDDDRRRNADKTSRARIGRPWKKGQSGNPRGRPKGSRNKLAEAFIADYHAEWEIGGRDVLAKLREEDPAEFARLGASILPREIKIDPTRELTDEELDAEIERRLAEAKVVSPPVAAQQSTRLTTIEAKPLTDKEDVASE